jgi:hypothetical protein
VEPPPPTNIAAHRKPPPLHRMLKAHRALSLYATSFV